MSEVITTNDLSDYLPGTLDAARAGIIVDSVNAYIESQTHRCWGETRTVTEDYDLGKTLWLDHMDVTAISSITVGWPGQTQQTLDATGYYFNKRGRVTMINQAMFGQGNVGSSALNDYVHVTYTYGVEDVPSDLKEAALGVAAGLYNWATAGGKEIVASSVGSYRIETAGAVRGTPSATATPWQNAAEAHFSTINGYAMQRL